MKNYIARCAHSITYQAFLANNKRREPSAVLFFHSRAQIRGQSETRESRSTKKNNIGESTIKANGGERLNE